MIRRQNWGVSPGVGFAIAAPLLYSTLVPLSKIFLRQVDAWMLAGLLDLGAGLGMVMVYLLREAVRRRPIKNGLAEGDWRWFGASIFAGGLLGPVLQTYGIAHSMAASASLLLNLEGVFTGLIAWIIFKEPFNKRVAWGLATITSGSVILIGAGESMFKFSLGSLAVVGACLGWATASNLTHKISNRDPIQLVMLKTCVTGSLNVAFALAIGNTLPVLSVLGAIALTGFLCIGLTFLCYIMALRHVGTSRTGAFFSLFPFSGAILAIFILGEPVTPNLLVAGGLMAFGVCFCLNKQRDIA